MQYHSNTGDTSTLDDLILSCVEPVNRMAHKYCGNFSDYDDFVSVGMLKVCEVAAHAQAVASDPLMYLCGAARHAMIDEFNRLHRLAVVSLDVPLSDDGSLCLADLVPDCSSAAPAAPDSFERRRALHSAIERLSVHQRAAVLRLAGLPGYGTHSIEEAARALHTCSNKAAQMAAYHGRRNLARDGYLVEALGLEVGR